VTLRTPAASDTVTGGIRPERDWERALAVRPSASAVIFDRRGRVFRTRTICEIKTNNKGWSLEKAHPIQTALQAILVSAQHALPAEAWSRLAIYLRPNGQFRVEHHRDKRDFDRAYEVIRRCCR